MATTDALATLLLAGVHGADLGVFYSSDQELRTPANGAGQLFLIDLDGSNLRRVFFESPDDRQPAWRP